MDLLTLLQKEPRARERKNKWRAVAKILQEKYPELKEIDTKIDQSTLADMLNVASSLDREWRKILQENVHLRGEDYHHKEKLVSAKQKELGYK